MKESIVSVRRAPQRTKVLSAALSSCIFACALLGVGCGGRTGFEGALPWSSGGAGGVGGAGAGGAGGAGGVQCSKDWNQILWDDSLEEAVVYLWTDSATDSWAVVSGDSPGPQSFFRDHWDGSRWTRTASEGDASARFENQQIWATDARQAFAGSRQQLQRWSGTAWVVWSNSPGCHAIAGTASNDVWCATDNQLWRFDGSQWTAQLMSNGIQGILAKARDDVWIWGAQGASHFNGTRWTLELSAPIKRVSASGPHDIWAVEDGDLLHSTGPGSAWTRQNPTGGQIASVWSQSADNTWIVAAGAAMRWNGTSWVLMELPMTDERLLISGSTEDIWIAGTLKLAHGHPVCR